jgi:hypothetical protein
MTQLEPTKVDEAGDLTDVEAAEIRKLRDADADADANAALDYLCLHADAWPGGRGVATRIRRHRRPAVPAAERRAG